MNKKITRLSEELPADRTQQINFHNLIEKMPVMIYAAAPRPPYSPIYISSAFETFGYSLEEWYKSPDLWIRMLHDEDRERVLREAEEKLKNGGEIDTEYRLIERNGAPRWVRDRSCFVRDEAGNAVCWQGVIIEIGERKRVQQALSESEQRYRQMFEGNQAIKLLIDVESGAIVDANPAACRFYGYPHEEFKSKKITDLNTLPADEIAREMKRAAAEQRDYFIFRHRLASGAERDVEVHSSPFRDEKRDFLFSIIYDITERKQAEKALRKSEESYRNLSESIMHQVWTATPNGTLDYINRRAIEYFGLTTRGAIDEGWKDKVHPEDLPICVERWTRSLETGKDYDTEFRLRDKNGDYRWHSGRATAALDTNGSVIKWFGTNTDIDDQKMAEAKLNYYALHDGLTNLPNRAKFMNHLARSVSRAEYNSSFCFAVLFLDLDRFKIINDSLGHSVGDKLLIALAKRLESCVRPGDIVARLGGDEFTVLLNNISDSSDAARVADRFLEKLSEPFNLDTYEVFTSASIGIIVSDEIHRQPEDFLRDADTAMYRAKEAGKARYEIFDREMHIRNINLLQTENDLRRAIEHNEFRVFYQPLVALDTGEIREFEALIRWQHPIHGLVMPDDFIHIAEETGLIISIGEWILREACRQTAEWQKKVSPAKSLSVSVNLSAKQLLNPNLTAQISRILKQTALEPQHLKLEITESMVMENSEKALSVISGLNNLGISLSTDDFGTGYSSLSYLHKFPFSRLKIDRSFVSKMDVDRKSEAIVRTILLLGQNLNIETIAEGIETEKQLELLQSLGCKTGQGYLFSSPLEGTAAAKLLGDGLPRIFENSLYNYRETEKHLLESDKIQ